MPQAWQGGVRKRIKKAQQLGRLPRTAKVNPAAKSNKTQQQESDSQFKALLARFVDTQAVPTQAVEDVNTGAETDQRLLPPAPDTQESVKMPVPINAIHNRSTPAGQWSLDLRNIAMD